MIRYFLCVSKLYNLLILRFVDVGWVEYYYGAKLELYWQGVEMEVLGEKPVQVPLCPLQIPYLLVWHRTRFSYVRFSCFMQMWNVSYHPDRQELAGGISAESSKLKTSTWETGRNSRVNTRGFLTEDPKCRVMIFSLLQGDQNQGVRWAEQVVRMWGVRNAFRNLVKTCYGKKRNRGARRSSDNIIKMNVKNTECEKMGWIQLT